MITDHITFRRVLQWAFPGAMVEMTEKWDGTEDKQAFLDRACVWSGAPITVAEIEAKEADYNTAMTGLLEKAKDELATDLLLSEASCVSLLRAYALAINDGSIIPGTNMTNAALKAAVKAKL